MQDKHTFNDLRIYTIDGTEIPIFIKNDMRNNVTQSCKLFIMYAIILKHILSFIQYIKIYSKIY